MHQIKKYANRKMYDVTNKKYVTMDDISDLVQRGEDISIVDNTSGEDITQEIVSQLLGRVLDGQARKLPLSIVVKLLRKGSGEIVGYTRKYLSFWQNALNLAEDELDKANAFIGTGKSAHGGKGNNLQVKGLEDGRQEDITILKMLDGRIEQRVEELLAGRVAGFQEKIAQLNTEITKLTARIETFENIFSQVMKTASDTASKPGRKTKQAKADS
jgi:polyhydroxyalkanoate synthesis repressor PhaR